AAERPPPPAGRGPACWGGGGGGGAPGHPAAVLPRRRRRRVAVRRATHHVQEQLHVLDARRERPLGRVVHPRRDRLTSDPPVPRAGAGPATARGAGWGRAPP